jgi:uncharacterized protein (DUF1697 family)
VKAGRFYPNQIGARQFGVAATTGNWNTIEKRLGVPVTPRNWNTIEKVATILRQDSQPSR